MPAKRLPDKMFYRIGEISRYTGLEPHVLRYWETEFEQLAPNKSGSRQRLYRRQDVDLILKIKGLLYDQGYTIQGAKKALGRARARNADAPPLPEAVREDLRSLRREIESLVEILKET
ncbi:MAG: MerR family transcriptional regulator [Nitrospirae bacterium]|nr:MerR family transcriptional regulator [Nitrospirota bacterium]